MADLLSSGMQESSPSESDETYMTKKKLHQEGSGLMQQQHRAIAIDIRSPGVTNVPVVYGKIQKEVEGAAIGVRVALIL